MFRIFKTILILSIISFLLGATIPEPPKDEKLSEQTQQYLKTIYEEIKRDNAETGFKLPSGAIFFMFTTCPTGTTDISSTYSNKFVRINATGGSTGGSDTDSITLTTTELPAHTHTYRIAGDSVGGTTDRAAIGDTAAASSFPTTSSTGSGTAFTVDTVPAFVTAKMCQVN